MRIQTQHTSLLKHETSTVVITEYPHWQLKSRYININMRTMLWRVNYTVTCDLIDFVLPWCLWESQECMHIFNGFWSVFMKSVMIFNFFLARTLLTYWIFACFDFCFWGLILAWIYVCFTLIKFAQLTGHQISSNQL